MTIQHQSGLGLFHFVVKSYMDKFNKGCQISILRFRVRVRYLAGCDHPTPLYLKTYTDTSVYVHAVLMAEDAYFAPIRHLSYI